MLFNKCVIIITIDLLNGVDYFMNLIKLTENVYVLQAPVNVGFILNKGNDKTTTLIDSGSSDDYGKKIYKVSSEIGWRIENIINTHSHADHIGGNHFLQNKLKCRIFATKFESLFIENPILEPMYLYGGLPFKEIDTKFLRANPSIVSEILIAGTNEELGVDIIPLPGHSFEMIGVFVDSVLFVADSVVSRDVINKYKIFYLTNLKEQLKTLEGLNKWINYSIKYIVLSHGEIFSKDDFDKFENLITLNLSAIEEVKALILDFCIVPKTIDDLIMFFANKFSLKINPVQYVLLSQTLKAYCNYLRELNKLDFIFNENNFRYVALNK